MKNKGKRFSILYLGNRLSKHGFTPTSVETLGENLGEIVNVIRKSDKKNRILRLIDMAWSIIKNKNIVRLVVIDTYSGKAFIYAFLCSRLCLLLNLKYIMILHGGDLANILRTKKTIAKMIFSLSYINISPSRYLQNVFIDSGFQVKYLPNSIILNNYNFKLRKRCEPKLLWVRSIHKIYNPSMAIRVTSKLKKYFPNVKLCMVGPNKDNSKELCMTMIKELCLEKHVSFAGLMLNKDWISLSTQYDIFINTTNYDNLPVSLIEAMALGMPIVTTNVGGIKYLQKHRQDALLVERDDCDEMVKNIREIIANKTLAENLSINARKKSEEFDWEFLKLEWQQTFRSC